VPDKSETEKLLDAGVITEDTIYNSMSNCLSQIRNLENELQVAATNARTLFPVWFAPLFRNHPNLQAIRLVVYDADTYDGLALDTAGTPSIQLYSYNGYDPDDDVDDATHDSLDADAYRNDDNGMTTSYELDNARPPEYVGNDIYLSVVAVTKPLEGMLQGIFGCSKDIVLTSDSYEVEEFCP
jgi:hypothetical protein